MTCHDGFTLRDLVSFEHKHKACSGGAFFDPRNGGECWKCPSGYSRTIEAVTSKKACVKDSPDALKPAKLEGHFGCAKGQFIDVSHPSECWSCPSSHPYRTINALDSHKACASSLIGIFAAEGNAFCSRILRAIKAGDRGVQDLQKIVETVTRTSATIRGPIPLPTDKHRYTVIRGPHIDKDSREHFEMRVHKRLIDIVDPNAKTIDSLQRIELPAGVDIEIKIQAS